MPDARICQGPNCDASIEERRLDAKYCSGKCRNAARLTTKEGRAKAAARSATYYATPNGKATAAARRATPTSRAKQAATSAACQAAKRNKAMDTLGGTCKCCGETEKVILDFEHPNNNGWEDRKENGSISKNYKAIIDGTHPYRIELLCANCHARMTRQGRCGASGHRDELPARLRRAQPPGMPAATAPRAIRLNLGAAA